MNEKHELTVKDGDEEATVILSDARRLNSEK